MSQSEPKKPEENQVWMNCRATEGCEGKYAKVVFEKTIPLVHGGGTAIRYRCLKCNGVWHLRR